MKRIAFWLLLALFYVAVTWWILHTPHEPERLFQALPEQAALLSFQSEATHTLPRLLHNPLAIEIMRAWGFDTADFSTWLATPDGQELTDWLLASDSALAYVPPGVLGPDDIWALAAWLGPRQTILARLLLGTVGMPSVSKHTTYRARPIYRVELDDPAIEGDMFFFLVEGGLIGSLSKNPFAIHYLADRYDRKQSATGRDYLRLLHDDFTHQATFWGRVGQPGTGGDFALFEAGPLNLKGAYRMPNRMGLNSASTPQPPALLDRLLGPIPQGFLQMDALTLLGRLAGHVPGGVLTVASMIYARWQPPVIYAALLEEPFQGRLMGMRVPAIVLGLPLPNEGDPSAVISELVDRINASFRLGLVAESVLVSGLHLVYALEGTGEHAYSRTPFRDRVAYTVLENHLLICNSADALKRLVARHEGTRAHEQASQTPWRDNLFHQHDGSNLDLWFDLDRGARTLRLALTGHAMTLARQGPEAAERASWIARQASLWTAALAPLGQVTLRLEANGEQLLWLWHFGN